MPWPKPIPWHTLPFGVELEFVGARLGDVELVDGWEWRPEDALYDAEGALVPELVAPDVRGGEVGSPVLTWRTRGQVAEMTNRLRTAGGVANWSCGLHVHVSLEPWGRSILLPMLDAAIISEEALRGLLRPAPHRAVYLPPTTPAVRERFLAARTPEEFETLFVYDDGPWSTRGGINLRAWADYGTVEFRLPNGSLDAGEIELTVKLCLKWVAAVGRGVTLPATPDALAKSLAMPLTGYPAPQTAPDWWPDRLAWHLDREAAQLRGEA